MRECDAQPKELVAHSRINIHCHVCVADRCSLHTRTAGWIHDQYFIMSVIQELDTVCVNVMHSQ